MSVDYTITSLSCGTEPQKALVLQETSHDSQVTGPTTLVATPGEEGNGTEQISWRIHIKALNLEIQRAEMCSKAREIEFCERFQCKPTEFLMRFEFQLVNYQYLLQENANWLLNFKKQNEHYRTSLDDPLGSESLTISQSPLYWYLANIQGEEFKMEETQVRTLSCFKTISSLEELQMSPPAPGNISQIPLCTKSSTQCDSDTPELITKIPSTGHVYTPVSTTSTSACLCPLVIAERPSIGHPHQSRPMGCKMYQAESRNSVYTTAKIEMPVVLACQVESKIVSDASLPPPTEVMTPTNDGAEASLDRDDVIFLLKMVLQKYPPVAYHCWYCGEVGHIRDQCLRFKMDVANGFVPPVYNTGKRKNRKIANRKDNAIEKIRRILSPLQHTSAQ